MLKLGINGWRIHGRRTGVGRYLLNVVRHWTPEAIAEHWQAVTFYTPKAVDRREIPLPSNIRERVLRPNWRMLLWENLRLAPVATDDVLFCPSYTRPLLARGKTVVTLHDAVQHLYPELFPLPNRLFYNHLYHWSARHATLVITDSDAARQDIVRRLGVPASRIRVVYLAPAELFKPIPKDRRVSEVRERYVGADVPYFLFVGKLSGRRNIPRLLESFAEFKRRTSAPHKMLVIGLNVKGLDFSTLVAEFGLSGELKHWEYVPDSDLNLIFNAAEAYIMPSVYETVSLPVMEAQATGTPVICIDTAGMREITGGAALLIRKLEVSDIADAMSRLAGDAGLRRELAEQGLANARRFSWERCSTETLAVLEEAARLTPPTRSSRERRRATLSSRGQVQTV